MTGITESMTARTEGMVGSTAPAVRQPSKRALATRSFTAASRLAGEARREALREHFELFVPSMNRSCPVRR